MKSKLFAAILILFVFSSCSINRMAINAVSDALTGSSSVNVFTADSDPQLVGDALPFAIKLYETLLSQNPNHQGLMLTLGSLFIMYANAFVQGPADMLDPIDDYFAWDEGRERARLLYLRGYEHLSNALERKFPGFNNARVEDGTLAPILNRFRIDDVPLLYWTVAGGLSAYSLDPFGDFDLGMRLREWEAMMARAYQLNPEFNNGAIDEFYIQFYASAAADILGLDKSLAETHFHRAVERSGGLAAGPYVSYAMAITVPAQDHDAFVEYLEMALAIDPEDDPSNRLLNIINQRRARHLLDTAYQHFSFLPLPYSWDWDDGF